MRAASRAEQRATASGMRSGEPAARFGDSGGMTDAPASLPLGTLASKSSMMIISPFCTAAFVTG